MRGKVAKSVCTNSVDDYYSYLDCGMPGPGGIGGIVPSASGLLPSPDTAALGPRRICKKENRNLSMSVCYDIKHKKTCPQQINLAIEDLDLLFHVHWDSLTFSQVYKKCRVTVDSNKTTS